jgi:TM2 domain-containing membrane protein YozV
MSDSNPYGQPPQDPNGNPYGYPQGAQPGYGAAPGQPPAGGQPTYGYPYPGADPNANAYAQQPPMGAVPGMPMGYDPGAMYGVDPYGRPYSDKQKLTAGLLGIFLGGFGVGRFYTGHTGIGVAQLLVSLFTCGIGAFWGLIDGIIMLASDSTDAQGRPLRP